MPVKLHSLVMTNFYKLPSVCIPENYEYNAALWRAYSIWTLPYVADPNWGLVLYFWGDRV